MKINAKRFLGFVEEYYPDYYEMVLGWVYGQLECEDAEKFKCTITAMVYAYLFSKFATYKEYKEVIKPKETDYEKFDRIMKEHNTYMKFAPKYEMNNKHN